MGLYGPINEKPPTVGEGGLTGRGIGLTLKLHFKRDGSLTDCSSPVNHPTTPCSGLLVGVTTRSNTLNLDRGSQPLGTRRIVGKREWQPRGRTLAKSRRQRMAPSVIKLRTIQHRRTPSMPCGFTISHRG